MEKEAYYEKDNAYDEKIWSIHGISFITMVFGVACNLQAEEDDTRDIGQVIDVYDPDKPGSITVTLPDLEGAEE